MKKYFLLVVFGAALFVLGHHPSSIAAGNSWITSLRKTPAREVNVHDRYSMMIPEYLQKDSTLNNEASLQYSNNPKEVYVIVIDEPTQDFIETFKELNDYDSTKSPLENYARAQMVSIRENMAAVTYESKMRKLKTGCGKAISYEVSGFQDGIDGELGFTVGFIQGKLNLYMQLSWTYQKQRDVYQEDMDAMITSFREISGAIDTYPYSICSGRMFLRVPNDVTRDDDYTDASLSYGNDERDLHFIVIESPFWEWDSAYASVAHTGQSMLEFVTRFQIDECKRNLINVHDVSKIQTASGHGLSYKSFNLVAQPHNSDEEMYYKFRVVNGNYQFYILQCWTPVRNRGQNESDMDLMLNSFDEI